VTKPILTEVLEIGLFGLAGVVVELQESLPKLVAKGKSTLEPKLSMARFVGQFAVARFETEFQRRTDSTIDQITEMVLHLFGESKDGEPCESEPVPTYDSIIDEPNVSDESAAQAPASLTVDAGHLHIAGYRTLSAQQIIARLGSLNQSELDEIEQYESNNRNRTSILRSIAAKRARL